MNEDLSALNLVELIDLLEPVPEPAAVSMWPQTVAWLWLALLAICLAALAAYRLQRRYRADAYRRAALKELEAARGNPTAVARILRRAAIAGYGRHRVAALHGRAWLQFLDSVCDDGDFDNGAGRALATAPYCRDGGTDDLTDVAAAWIRRHKVGGT